MKMSDERSATVDGLGRWCAIYLLPLNIRRALLNVPRR